MSKIHVWIPNIFEFKGGIQVYSRFFLEALHSFKFVTGRIILKHDRRIPSSALIHFNSFHFHCLGQWPLFLRTVVFSLQLLWVVLIDRPKLIITTHLNFTPLAYYLKYFFKIPYWTIAHGVDAWDIQDSRLRQSLSNAELILSVGQYTRHRLLREQTLQPEQVKLLPNTFNAQAFQISSKPSLLLDRYQIEYQKAIILTVARLDSTERYKGYDQIIKALPQIKAEVPDIHYILVGKGNDKSRIEKLIHDLNLEACVTLTGFIPDEELCDHYNLCDVFAMPSKGEGFGIVYLEALACGKPTLGGNQDGAIDALCQGELGALVDPDNIDEIARTLVQILQGTYPNPLMYQPQALRQKVIEVYGFQAFQDKLLGLLQKTDLVN